MRQSLIAILRGPVTRSPLRMASTSEIDAVNEAIGGGRVDAAGTPVRQRVVTALVATEGGRFYRVEDGIPVLLADEAIRVEAADASSTAQAPEEM